MMFNFQQSGFEGWGVDSSNHALLKESNWLPYISLTPKQDLHQVKRWTELKQTNKTDEILRVMAHFIKVKDADVILFKVFSERKVLLFDNFNGMSF